MESLNLEEENITEDIRNLFRPKKETKATKDRILRDIKNLSEHEKEEVNYYKPVRVSSFWSSNYIEYKTKVDKNKTLSVEEYLHYISLYLTLSQFGFFMYIKQLGWGKITPPK